MYVCPDTVYFRDITVLYVGLGSTYITGILQYCTVRKAGYRIFPAYYSTVCTM
jgi:hypothetical protein